MPVLIPRCPRCDDRHTSEEWCTVDVPIGDAWRRTYGKAAGGGDVLPGHLHRNIAEAYRAGREDGRSETLAVALDRVQHRAVEVRRENIPGAPHRVAALDETAAWLAEEIHR